MRKKLFTLLLAAAASVGSVIASTKIGDLYYNLDDTNQTAEVTSQLTSITIANIPASVTYNSKTYSVTSIGSYAFYRCSSLTSVTIGNSVTSIGSYAFYRCSSLTSVTIGNSVTSIGKAAFSYCLGLTSVTIGNSVTSIGEFAFSDCSGLTSIEIPNSVTSIGNAVFCRCDALTSININAANPSYCSVDGVLFSKDKTVLVQYPGGKNGEYTIPNGVTSIGEFAFPGCSGLTSVTIPNSVTSIGYYAFSGCSSLTSVTIGNSVTSIGGGAFRDCTSLTSVTIPDSVTSIGSYAFSGCSSLTSVTIGNSVTSIGDYAFEYCRGLTSVTIPNNVTSIGNGAFSQCSSLTSVTIPNSVTSIGYRAFDDCSSLKSVTMESGTPPSVGNDTFESSTPVYVPLGSLKAYQDDKNWKKYDLRLFDTTIKTSAVSPTSAAITFSASLNGEDKNKYIAACGMEEGEEFSGNTAEYIGLEPESEYADVPFFIRTTKGDIQTVTASFKTSALELTTLASKAVSNTTSILLAETNMSDAETSCGFEWRRNDQPADMSSNKVFCPVANGLMAGRQKGLKDDIYYKYRAFYQSAAGNIYYGDWQYIFTGDVAVEFDPILYTYAASFINDTEATLNGYALAGSEDFTEQGFEYWAESRANGGANAPRRVPAALNEHFFVQASGIALRATLSDLDAGTVYKYRVYGKTGDQYYYGSEQSFTTQGEYEGDDSEGIDEVPSDDVQCTKAQKILSNGQIFILRGEKEYTVTGQEVK